MMATSRVLLVSALWGIVLGYPLGQIWARERFSQINPELVLFGAVLGFIVTGWIWLKFPSYRQGLTADFKNWFSRWFDSVVWATFCAILGGAIAGVLLAVFRADQPGTLMFLARLSISPILGMFFGSLTGWLTLCIPILGPLWIWSLEKAIGKP